LPELLPFPRLKCPTPDYQLQSPLAFDFVSPGIMAFDRPELMMRLATINSFSAMTNLILTPLLRLAEYDTFKRLSDCLSPRLARRQMTPPQIHSPSPFSLYHYRMLRLFIIGLLVQLEPLLYSTDGFIGHMLSA